MEVVEKTLKSNLVDLKRTLSLNCYEETEVKFNAIRSKH